MHSTSTGINARTATYRYYSSGDRCSYELAGVSSTNTTYTRTVQLLPFAMYVVQVYINSHALLKEIILAIHPGLFGVMNFPVFGKNYSTISEATKIPTQVWYMFLQTNTKMRTYLFLRIAKELMV